MTELERALLGLGEEIDFPAAPDLVTRVRERLEPRGFDLFARRNVVAVALAVLVVAFGIAMAVPQARSAILRFFHIGAVTVERVETLPPAQQQPLAAGLGPALVRKDAEMAAHLGIRLGRVVPTPTQYYARPGLIATFVRVKGKPVLLAELSGEQVGLAKKVASGKTKVEPVKGLGEFAIWLSGGKHVLTWEFEGSGRSIETRLAGNVLVWLHGGRTYRLEGGLDKSQMVQLARKITP